MRGKPSKDPKGRGRPSKMTAETKKALYQGIQAGLSYELSCQAAGISYATLRSWIATAQKLESGELKAEDIAGSKAEFLSFLEGLKKAEGDCAKRLLTLINRSANEGVWQAGAWVLERRHPETFGRRSSSERTQPPPKPLQSEDVEDPKAAYLAELRWLRERAESENNLELALRALEHEAQVTGLMGETDEAEINAFLSGVHTVKGMAPEDLSE